MSLGTWFRDYVYIPLGGNRVSKGRWVFNTMVVWMLTGFWHGAEWNFIIWGLYFGIILLLEKFFILKFFDKLPKVLGSIVSHVYTLFLTVMGFVIFNETSLSGVGTAFSAMFGGEGLAFSNAETIYYLRSYVVVIIVAAVLSTPIIKKLGEIIRTKSVGNGIISVLQPVCYIAILALCTASLINGSFNPFIYFRF